MNPNALLFLGVVRLIAIAPLILFHGLTVNNHTQIWRALKRYSGDNFFCNQ